MGTRGGLTEFDGGRFRNYTTAHGLNDNFVWRLAEDRDGNLWMATRPSGATKLTLNGFTSFNEADGLGHATIHSIFEDLAGQPFVVSGNWVINRFDGERFTWVQPELLGDAGSIWASQVGFLDRTGQWWFLTVEGLYRFAPSRRLQQLTHQRPQAIYTSRDGLAADSAFRLFEDSRGDIWVSTSVPGTGLAGLARWDRATDTFHAYSEADGLPPANPPSAFCEDRSGALWIGFYLGGLARYEAGGFTLFTVADGVPAGGIHALHLDRAGRLWVASIQGGLGRLDDLAAEHPRFIHYTIADGLSSNNVRCLTEDQ
jgi:ligand-binding sensor domain-containing protein